MKNTIKIISMLSAAGPFPAVLFAATEEPKASPAWYDKFTVGKNLDSKDDASISFTSPGEGKDSYAVDIGVSYLLMDDVRWSVSPVVEYHRNTALKKEQDMISGGIQGSYLIGDVVTAEGVPSFAVMTDESLRYKRDGASDVESWMPTLMFTPLYSPWGLGSSVPISDLLRLQPTLLGGFVYEDGVSGEDGNALRAKVEAGVTLIPQGDSWKNLMFTMSNIYWNELTASGRFDDGKDDFNMFKVNAIYYLIPKEKNNDSLGVKLEYWNGADPDESLEDQSAVTFGFVFSL